MEEIWKKMICYEGTYEVSNLGRVKSVKKNLILTGNSIKNGYNILYLSEYGKTKKKLLHKAVAMAFCENPKYLPFVNHINRIKSDNRAVNLEWCTSRENNIHYQYCKKYKTSVSIKYLFEIGYIIPDSRGYGILNKDFCHEKIHSND